MTAIAFVGLGDMGARMAARLLASGHELTLYNRTAERARPLVEAGATAAASPADAARGAELAVTMLADPAALSAVVEGEAGLTEGLARDATLIEMSTVGPDAVERLRRVLPSSVGLLDSPVLGSLGEAEAGTLRLFVGGPEALAERWMPLLGRLARRSTRASWARGHRRSWWRTPRSSACSGCWARRWRSATHSACRGR